MSSRNRFVLLSASSLYRVPSIFLSLLSPRGRVVFAWACNSARIRRLPAANRGVEATRFAYIYIYNLSLPSFSRLLSYIYNIYIFLSRGYVMRA